MTSALQIAFKGAVRIKNFSFGAGGEGAEWNIPTYVQNNTNQASAGNGVLLVPV